MGGRGFGWHRVSRRSVLAGAGAGVVATSASACDLLSTEPSSEQGSAAAPADRQAKESPDLTAQVKSGALPPLKDRLPDQPLTLDPVDEPGSYGGDWRYVLDETDCPGCHLVATIGQENLVAWKPKRNSFTVDDIIPNVAEKFEVNDRATAYTFTLREGLRWSDGKPYNADDVMFWYDSVITNKSLTPAFPEWLTGGGKPVVVEKLSQRSVVFRFAGPNGMFLQNLATSSGRGIATMPAHYLKQFHADHADDIDKVVKENSQDTWYALFLLKADETQNPKRPVLNSWLIKQGLGHAKQRLVAVRNPYCWKVDSVGRQLPYLDRVVYTRVQTAEAALLKTTNGEVDLRPELDDLKDKPIYARNSKRGDYHFFAVQPVYMNTTAISLNLTHNDPVKRKVFQDKNFRIGLSLAIDRQEIIDAAHQRQGKPYQCAPRPESPFYNEKLATQYTERNVAAANEHLDRVLPDRDGDGMRLGPDGRPFGFSMETPSGSPPDDLELIRQYWRKVGVQMRVKPESRELFFTRANANKPDATLGFGDGGLGVILDPRSYFPYGQYSLFAIPWANWYQKGGLHADLGPETDILQEPPEIAQQQMRIYDRIKATADPDEQGALIKRILAIAVDQFWLMGICLPTGWFGIARNDFRNVQKKVVQQAGKSDVPEAEQYFKGDLHDLSG